MMNNPTLCIRVSDATNCPKCKQKEVVKNVTTKNKEQKYYCKKCGKRFIANYTYQAYKSHIDKNIIQFTKEGLGIRSTARILKISTTTLLKRIISIAAKINRPVISKGKIYDHFRPLFIDKCVFIYTENDSLLIKKWRQMD